MLALLMSFVACDKEKPDNAQSSVQETTVYDTLNELSRKYYSKIQLNISTLTGDIELGAEYVLAANKVEYSIEQLNLLPSDGDIDNISPNYKTTIQGLATIENGKVTKMDDKAVNIPPYDELKGSFDFKDSCFKNVQIDEGRFSADVVNASAFIGIDEAIGDMKVIVNYSDSAFQKITIVCAKMI